MIIASLRVFPNEFVVEGEKLGVHLAHQRHVAQDSRVLSLFGFGCAVSDPHAYIHPSPLLYMSTLGIVAVGASGGMLAQAQKGHSHTYLYAHSSSAY